MKYLKFTRLMLIMQVLFILIYIIPVEAEEVDSLLKRLGSSAGKDKIEILNQLTMSYWVNSPEKSLKYGAEALKLSRQLHDHESECKTLRNIGVAYSYMSQYNRALNYFKESLGIAKEHRLKKEEALSLNSLGNYNYLTGNLDKALDYYKQAIQIGEEIGSKPGLVSYINNVGVIYSNMGKNDSALEYYFKSLKISEEIKDKAGISKAYLNIGAVYNDIKNYSKALEFYNKALKISVEINDQYLKANTLNNMGNIYSAQGNGNKALEFYQQSLKIRENIGDEFGAAVSLGDIGSIYSHMGKNNLALEYQERAYKMQEKIGNTEGEIVALLNIGITYKNIGKYKDAIESLNKAEIFAANFNVKLLLDIYEEKANLYEKLGNYNEAYNTYRLYKELNDSLFNENSSLQIAELQTKYETEKKDKEISLLLRDKQINELNLNRNALVRNSLIAGIIILILAGLVIINRNRKIKKANSLLEEKIKLIDEQKNELKSLNANKDKLLSIISHDLRSPFQALVGYSELLAVNIEDLSKQEITEYSMDINSTAHQTLELLENLLEWSRLQLGKIQYTPVRISVEPFINKTMRLMLHAASVKEVLIKAEIPQSFTIFADEPMITSALHNLLSNAVKFSNKQGSILVEATTNGEFAQISVKDSGIGISKENINKIFNKDIHFSTKGTNEEKGSGLGLELTKELVERNGGQISVVSEEGVGSTFTLTVPVAK